MFTLFKGESGFLPFCRYLLLLVLVLGMCSDLGFSQVTTGSLTGTVTDPTDAVIVGAAVTAVNNLTGADFHTTTNSRGVYVFPNLPLGKYTVTVETAGFAKAELTNIMIEVATQSRADAKLEIARTAGQVTVVEEGQQVVNTVSAELNTVVARRQILDLPLPTRNPIDLARLQAGVAVQSGTNARTAVINGLRGNLTNITQDGVNVQDNFVRTDSLFALSAPTVENTGEFSVAIGTINADSGTGAVQVRIVTPSGTNEIHGSVFEFMRRNWLNANSFFNNLSGIPRDFQKQDRFGVRAGGPFYIPKVYDGRNKTFWFFAYEGFREPFSATRNRTVFTQQAKQGIFQYLGSNGQLQSVNLLSIAPSTSPKSLNALTQSMLAIQPPPNNTLVGDGFNTAGYQYQVNGSDPSDRWTLRVDQKLTEKALGGQHNLSFVINRGSFLLRPDTFNAIEAPFPGGIDAYQSSKRTQLSTAITSVFGARATNEFRFGMQRAPVGFILDQSVPRGFLVNFPFGASATTRISQTPDNTFVSQGRTAPVYAFVDNFNYVKGTHNMKMGFEIRSSSGNDFNDVGIFNTVALGTNPNNPDGLLIGSFPNLPAGAAGNTIFSNARAVYQTVAGLINNVAQTFNVSSFDSGYTAGQTRRRVERYRDYNFYVIDQWRVRPNLTFNLGLRYEYQTVIDVVNGFALQPENYVASLYGISGQGNLFQPGVTPGTAVNNLVPGGTTNGHPFYKPDKNNFAPSVGFAWSPDFKSGPLKWLFGGSGQSSIRGGYAISYTREGFTVITNVTTAANANLGLSQTVSVLPTGVITSTGVPVTPPAFSLPRTDVQNYASSSGAAGFWTTDFNFRNPYVSQWSLGIEREIGKRTAIEARYVGNHGVKLVRAVDVNEVNVFENGFLQEFKNAAINLGINGGTSFAPGKAGTVPLPIFSALFTGLSTGSGYGNSTFINQLNTGQVGSMAFSLATSPTYHKNLLASFPANFFLANPNLNFARMTGNGGFSTYNAFQFEVRRRAATGLFLQANYTFSKALTDYEGSQSTLNAYRTWRNIGLDKHRADFDITHSFNGNWVYEMPFGTGKRWLNWSNPVLSRIFGGWQTQGLISWRSAPKKSILSSRGTFNQFTGFNSAVPIGDAAQAIANAIGIYRTGQGVFWIDPSLLNITTSAVTGLATSATLKPGFFTHPGAGTLGPMARNLFNGSRFFQLDFSILKRTRITETTNIEFRAEFFNFFNNANFSSSADLNFDSQNFGRITSTTGDPRVVQLGIRFNW